MAATVTLTTNAKLMARNGRTVHATAPNCQGVALCSPNMASKGYAPVAFMELKDSDDVQVTCKNCCRKLGIEAPKTLPVRKAAKKAIPVVEAPTADESRQQLVETATIYAGMDGVSVMDALYDMAVYHATYIMKARRGRRR